LYNISIIDLGSEGVFMSSVGYPGLIVLIVFAIVVSAIVYRIKTKKKTNRG
jgi:hypothetical protein